MAKCKYCGEKAGFLRKYHPQCQHKFEAGKRGVAELARSAATSGTALATAKPDIERLAAANFLPTTVTKQLLITAWEKAAESALEDSLLSKDEENSLGGFAAEFGLTQDELNAHLWWQRIGVAGALRDLAEGHFPERCQVTGAMPFNLQPKERLAWVFPAAAYEERTRTELVGKSAGVSIRIAKGVYYRTSAFRGNPVTTSYMHLLGTGQLGLTDKHLYFHSPGKAFRIAFKKVVTFVPYADGMGVHQEAVSAKPKVFVTGDGWSVYNLAVNLSQNQ